MTRVAVVGLGYVGLVTATVLARAGHDVVGLDTDADRVADVNAGRSGLHEPGLDDASHDARVAGNFTAGADAEAAYHGAAMALLCVPSPPGPDGRLDVTAVAAAAATAAGHLPPAATIVIRSTVNPDTVTDVAAAVHAAGRPDLVVVHAPEFLAEGTALHDATHPTRIVIGGDGSPDGHAACHRVAELFASVSPAAAVAPIIITDAASAALGKLAANTFLAARVSLIGEVARACEVAGGDVEDVAAIVGHDPRIGREYLSPGIGYGGSCLPKDAPALVAAAGGAAASPTAAGAARSNADQVGHQVGRLAAALGGLAGRRVAVWGTAFKPGTADTRESAALRFAERLRAAGVTVALHDPAAAPGPGAVAVTSDADALVLATAWPEYRAISAALVAQNMPGRVVLDGRNHLDGAAWAAAGFTVLRVGRPTLHPEATP